MNKKIGKIEIYRFYICVTIIIGHLFNNLSIDDYKVSVLTINNKFSLGVEFFLIISGFFIATSAFKSKATNLSKQTIIYTVKRIRSFFSEHFISSLFTLLIFLIYKKPSSLYSFAQIIIRFIPTLLLFTRWGFNEIIMDIEWYLSCLIICGGVLYFLILKYKHSFSRIAAPFLALILMCSYFPIENSYHSATIFVFNGFIHGNVVRSFSGMMIGVFIYEIVSYVQRQNINHKYKLFLSLIEIILLLICFYIKNQTNKKYELLYIMLLSISLIIILSNISLTNKYFNNPICMHLGKLSLSMYLVQYASIYITNMLYEYIKNGILAALICVVLCIIFAEIINILSKKIIFVFDKVLKEFLDINDFYNVVK